MPSQATPMRLVTLGQGPETPSSSSLLRSLISPKSQFVSVISEVREAHHYQCRHGRNGTPLRASSQPSRIVVLLPPT